MVEPAAARARERHHFALEGIPEEGLVSESRCVVKVIAGTVGRVGFSEPRDVSSLEFLIG